MNLNIINEINTDINPDFFNKIFAFFIQQENLNPSIQLDLSLVDDTKIKSINKKFRGVNKATDVLSFEFENKNLPFLGDIIIDIQQIIRQKGNNTIKQELLAVFIHALLHLIGHDHISNRQKVVMQKKENEYTKILLAKKELFT